jgi:sterol desaturase/sphingolipid hydroxylase (fatty acid hydroxylase superfamily)
VVSNARFFWISILGFVLIAAGLYAWRHRGKPLSAGGFLRFVFPKEIYAHQSAKITYKFYVVYGLINLVLPFEAFLGTGETTTAMTRGALTALFGAGGTLEAPTGLWVTALFTLIVFVAIDFGYFVAHVMLHKIPAFWEFHKVHHSVTAMQPMACSQLHPVEGIMQAVLTSIGAGLVIGSTDYVFANPPAQITVFNASILLLITNVVFLFRHSHVWLNFPYRISHLLCSPAMHQVHHSTNPQHWDKNFAVNFSVWDWLFKSLYVPRAYEKLSFGVPEESFSDFDTIKKLMVLPFKKSWRHLSGPPPAQNTSSEDRAAA